MGLYYHRTTKERYNEIQAEGKLKITGHVTNGKHFGDGIYLTSRMEEAISYGDRVLTLDIDDTVFLCFDSLEELNKYDIQSLPIGGLAKKLKSEGFSGFSLKSVGGSTTSVLYDADKAALVDYGYNLEIGDWLAVTEDGVWLSPYVEKQASFPTKKELIMAISDAVLDSRRVPKVKRIASGIYEYTPKDVDHNIDGNSFHLYKLTSYSLTRFKELLNETLYAEKDV